MLKLTNLLLIVTSRDSFSKEVEFHFKKFTSSYSVLKSFSCQEALNQPKEPAPFLVLIDLADSNPHLFQYVRRIAAHFSGVKIVCAGHPPDAALVIEFVKLGIKDFLKYPFDEGEIKALFEQMAASANGAASLHKEQKAKLITLYGPKGGVGVTLLTINLAVALAKDAEQGRIAVCDFLPQCGDVATYLNLNPQYTVRDIIENNPYLDISFLEGVMLGHSTGIRVLPAPRPEEEMPNFEYMHVVGSTLALLRDSYDTVLIDGGHLGPSLLHFVMSESDLILLMANPDVVSLKGLVNYYGKLKALGFEDEKIKVVVNRHNSHNHIDTREFEKKVNQPIAARLPNNYSLCIEAINSGRSLFQIDGKSELSKKILGLAELVRKSADSSDGNGARTKDSEDHFFLRAQNRILQISRMQDRFSVHQKKVYAHGSE